MSTTHRGKEQKRSYLLENLHLGPGLDTVFTFLGLGLSHTVTNTDQLSVDVFEASSDAILDSLLDLLLDETSGERFQGFVQEIVLRVSDREFEGGDLGVDRFNLEHRSMVLGRRYELDRHVDTLTTEDEVGEARVTEPRKTSLLPEVEGDVVKIRLDLAEAELDLMFGLVVDNTVRREFEVVLGGHGYDVGEQVLAREGEVFDDEVESIVGVLDTGNWDVADLTDDGRQNDLTDVVPKMGFELQRSFVIEEEVLCEASPVFPESFVQRVFAHLLEPVTNSLKPNISRTPFTANRSRHTRKRLSKSSLYFSS